MLASFGNQTTNASAAWHPEPRGRGTFNILSSCLTTMILCIWTAIHLNIPGHKESTKRRIIPKLVLLLLTLLAPEIVAWNAWEQRRVAMELTSAFRTAFEPEQAASPGWLRRARFYLSYPKRFCSDSEQGSSSDSEQGSSSDSEQGSSSDSEQGSSSDSEQGSSSDSEQGPPSDSRSKITLVHGFYAAMGGYVIPSYSPDKQNSITGQGRLTLTKYGVQWLLIHAKDFFPNLAEAEILDKSKASTLVKTLTCLQAFWFCLQCIVRLTMNTSISLLELNVFGHCICTFIIYAIWWHKPMDITEPTVIGIKGEPKHEGLVAWLSSFASRTVPRLPHPLAECAETGYKYIDWAGLFGSDDTHWQQRCAYSFETQFSASGPPIRGKDNTFWRGHAFDADYNEKQVNEYAGLYLERLKQLFNLDASLPQIKISMFEAASTSKVRLTVGTDQIGLTYYLSCAKLEQLNLKNQEPEELENSGPIPEKPKETSEDSYRLERSFLTWLDLESQYSRPSISHPWNVMFPRLWNDRIYEFQFQSDRGLDFFYSKELVSYPAELMSEWTINRTREWLAMSAAALIYGGLHLLAWSAPFQAPIYGLLWRISCIITASLGTYPLLVLFFEVAGRKVPWDQYADDEFIWYSIIAVSLSFLVMISVIPLYLFARVYLVVESFLSLTYLPESVLVTPNFSLYFPHIG